MQSMYRYIHTILPVTFFYILGAWWAEEKKPTISRLYFLDRLVFEGTAAQDFNIKTFFFIQTIANKTFQYTQQLLKCPVNPRHWVGPSLLPAFLWGVGWRE